MLSKNQILFTQPYRNPMFGSSGRALFGPRISLYIDLCGGFGNIVGGERRGLHTPADRARCGRRVCRAPCPHLALRWRASQWKGARYDHRLRDRTGRYPAGRSRKAVLAASLGAP